MLLGIWRIYGGLFHFLKRRQDHMKHFFLLRLSFVGREFELILRSSIFTLSGALRFHSLDQWISVPLGVWSLVTRYADLTKNFPLGSSVHTSLFGLALGGKWIDRIAWADSGSKISWMNSTSTRVNSNWSAGKLLEGMRWGALTWALGWSLAAMVPTGLAKCWLTLHLPFFFEELDFWPWTCHLFLVEGTCYR